MKKYLTIREFSQFSGIGETTLRYWDDISLFPPARRDPVSNYRFYTPHQIIAVNFITVLSNLNIPLKVIGQLMKRRTPESIVRIVEQKEKELDMEMRKLRERYSVIHTRLELVRYGQRLLDGCKTFDGVSLINDEEADINSGESDIFLLHRDAKSYILGPPNTYLEDEEFYEPFARFCNGASQLRINLLYPIGGYHEDFDQYMDAPGKPSHFFSLDPTGDRERPDGEYVVAFKRGYYGQMGDLPSRMKSFIEKNSLSVTGPVYVLYLLDEVCVLNPAEYLAQICVKVEKK